MQTTQAVLVVNTGSRRGRENYDLARHTLTELGLEVKAQTVDDPSDLPRVLDEVVAAEPAMLVLAGGDGTLSTAADRLSGTDVVLGVLPTGTANDLARTLQIPNDLAAACDTVVNGKTVDVDLGTLGADRFLNVASMGLSVGVTRALNPDLKRKVGALAYPIAAAQAYRLHKPFRAVLEFPEGDHETVELDDLLQVAVANGRFYGGGVAVAPDAGIDDHVLDVYAIPRGTAWERLQVLRHFVSGAFTEKDHVLHLKTRQVRVTTEPDVSINVDGELGLRTPQTFGIAVNALRVRVPATSDAAVLDGPAG